MVNLANRNTFVCVVHTGIFLRRAAHRRADDIIASWRPMMTSRSLQCSVSRKGTPCRTSTKIVIRIFYKCNRLLLMRTGFTRECCKEEEINVYGYSLVFIRLATERGDMYTQLYLD